MKLDILSLSPQAVIFVCVINTNGLLFLFWFLVFYFLFCVYEEEVYSPEHSCIGTVKNVCSPQLCSIGFNLCFPGIWYDRLLSAETQPKMTTVEVFKIRKDTL